jgi:non-specific protein-tyrosine kinase
VVLQVTQQASAPSSPVSPRPVLNIVLGFVLGLLLAVVLAVARDTLDNRVKTVEGFAKVAGAPAMGTVAEDPTAGRYPVAAQAGRQNVRAENFRQLRANLQFANVDEHPRVLAVTSSIPSEGKTMVAINLATTLAEAGFTVCLIDADLRRPTVASSLGLASPVGLTSVLISQIDMSEALQSAGPNLSVLTSGPIPPNPSEVLASSYVRDVVRGLLDRVDYVVLDTAPLLPVADGAEVAALADGTLLVARYKITTEAQLKRAALMLRRVDARLIGVLLNCVPITRRGEYGYSYYGYAGGSEELVAGKNGRSRGLGLRKRQETSGV